MMKIIIDDFHHNKRYSIRDRHDENLGQSKIFSDYKMVISFLTVELLQELASQNCLVF